MDNYVDNFLCLKFKQFSENEVCGFVAIECVASLDLLQDVGKKVKSPVGR